MPQLNPTTEPAAEWRSLSGRYDPDVHQAVHACVAVHQSRLATVFYERMLDDPAASFFLSSELVKTRLHPALRAWRAELDRILLVDREAGQAVRATLSTGVAGHDGPPPDCLRLLKAADAALHQAQHKGRDRVALHGAIP